MMKNNASIKSNDFGSSESYILLLELNENSYNYAIVNAENSSLVEIGSADISLYKKDSILFSYDFLKIKISVNTFCFSFIPTYLLSNNEINFHPFLGFQNDNLVILKNSIEADIQHIFGIDKLFEEFLRNNFKHIYIYSQAVSFYLGNKKQDGFYTNIKNGVIEILIIKNNSLFFYNLFNFNNDDELLYFMMLIAQQKNLDITSEIVYISGDIAQDSYTLQRIKNLFPNINFNLSSSPLSVSEVFDELQLHKYSSLLNLHLCE